MSAALNADKNKWHPEWSVQRVGFQFAFAVTFLTCSWACQPTSAPLSPAGAGSEMMQRCGVAAAPQTPESWALIWWYVPYSVQLVSQAWHLEARQHWGVHHLWGAGFTHFLSDQVVCLIKFYCTVSGVTWSNTHSPKILWLWHMLSVLRLQIELYVKTAFSSPKEDNILKEVR